MDEEDKPDLATELSTESSWTHLGGESENMNDYFFGSDGGERCILGDGQFGWSLQSGSAAEHGGGPGVVRPVELDLAGNTNPSGSVTAAAASSGSSGDPTEKVSTSGGSGSQLLTDSSKKVKRKASEKRMRLPRVAFMTKSEVDHLEDGYRWRKYGQKAVKNSPFPRSYYKCTNSKCTVKKRVERSSENPEIVITTYEGQHCHSIGFTRGGLVGYETTLNPSFSQLYFETQTQFPLQSHQFPESSKQLPGEGGLLGDVVSPRTKN